MKWQIAKSTLKQEIYELWNKEKKLLTLEFHSATNSARIEYAHEKRVFLIRKEGFLRSKIVLCNEYGIRLGHLVQDNKESYIELNNERFSFDINTQLLVRCGRTNEINSFLLSTKKAALFNARRSLIRSLAEMSLVVVPPA